MKKIRINLIGKIEISLEFNSNYSLNKFEEAMKRNIPYTYINESNNKKTIINFKHVVFIEEI